MDYNRDEALRAKEIAEHKFYAKDIVSAKKYAVIAQNLFPTLEGINQMIAILDIYVASETKINGESDLYAVLCVNASADEETVKKQYRKLALQLHPDKNKTIGAEGAFKLVSEAWSVLSDKSRKTAYDQKRNTRVFKEKVSQPKRDQSAPTNGFYNFAHGAPSKPKRTQKSTVKPDTFWTSCSHCRMQYEYLRVYLNHNLLCPNCHEAFLAIETGLQTNGSTPSVSRLAQQQDQHNSNHNSTTNNAHGRDKDQSSARGVASTTFQNGAYIDSYNNASFQWDTVCKKSGASSMTPSMSAAAQTTNAVYHTYEKVRKEDQDAQATTKIENALRKKSRFSKMNSSVTINFNTSMSGNAPDSEQLTKVDRPTKRSRSIGGDVGRCFGRIETEGLATKAPPSNDHQHFNSNVGSNGIFVDSGKARASGKQNNLNSEFAKLNLRKMLMEKAEMVIGWKLKEWNSAAAAKLVEKEEVKLKHTQRDDDGKKTAVRIAPKASNGNKLGKFEKDNGHIAAKKDIANDSDSHKDVIKHISINVPDPDFHDFDKDRSERCFKGDQVWATYDNEDGMPRFYALVQKVISLKSFKLRISFLNSKSNSELGPLNWIASGFTKTCGDFRIGKYKINDTVNIFSHKVKWEKGARGIIRIFPMKGDTWALYRNWSVNWNEQTPDDVIHKYDMVEVLDSYTDDQGVSVTPLVKVAGFKTVFHRHLDPKEIWRIPKEEVFRFSHQVPSYLLTGEEAHNAPKGCCELDPAATPFELLQVLEEVREDEVMETVEH